jgi:hypothetical protein
MAGLKGFLDLVDAKLEQAYAYVAPDHTSHRKPFLRGLDKVIEQFESGKPRGGASRQWSANNNVVRFEPKLLANPVKVDGKTVFHIPAERFTHAIGELRKSVEAGDLDEALGEAYAGGVKASGEREARQPRQRSAGSVRTGWSEERRAKFEATQAAKKAAKGG